MEADLDRLRHDAASWDAFVESTETDFPLQLSAWAAAKAATGWRAERVVADGGSGPIGGQLLVRRLGPGPFSVGYLPRGPVARRFDAASVDAFTEALRAVARARRLTHVTADPGLEGDAHHALLAAAGWRPADPVQLTSTQVIDLTRSEEELWSDVYKSSRRYANGARKRGCSVREGGRGGPRRSSTTSSSRRPSAAASSRAPSKPTGTSTGPSPPRAERCSSSARCRTARTSRASSSSPAGDAPRSCTAGLTDAGGEIRAGHFFEWQAIVRSKAAGARVFDMWGRSTPGIAHFKQGFGGRVVEYGGTWDLVVNPAVHALVHRGRRGLCPAGPAPARAGLAERPSTGRRRLRGRAGTCAADQPAPVAADLSDGPTPAGRPSPRSCSDAGCWPTRASLPTAARPIRSSAPSATTPGSSTPGDLFVARRGQHADGHDHVAAAVAAGAAAVIVERPVPGIRGARAPRPRLAGWPWRWPPRGAPATPRGAWASWASRAPTARPRPRTSCAPSSRAPGSQTGFVGTTDVIIGGRSLGNAARASTPEAPELQGYLAAMLAAGDRWAVVESTSHGLAQQRVGGVAYDVAVLTNVTSEHLEFHGTLEAYREAKQSLFARLASAATRTPRRAGASTPWSTPTTRSARPSQPSPRAAGARVLRYGLAGAVRRRWRRSGLPSDAASPDIVATAVAETPVGLRVPCGAGLVGAGWSCGWPAASTSTTPWRPSAWRRPSGWTWHAAAAALGRVEGVPGRMQRIDEGQPFSVIVDYAHTAEALGKVLDELAPADAVGRAHRRLRLGGRARRGQARPAWAVWPASAAASSCSPTRTRAARTAWPSWRPSPSERRRPACAAAQDLLLVPTAPRPSPWPSASARPGTSCCWPARATRRPSRRPAARSWDEAAVVRSTLRTLVG